MSETGTITVAPRIIDEFLAEMNQREIKFIERLSKEKTQEELLMQYHRFSTQEWCRYDPDLYFIVEGKCSEERPLSSFTYNAKKKNQSEGPLEIFINEHEEFRELLFLDKKINSDFSQYTGINSDDVHESKYFLYKLLLEKTSSVFSNKYFYNSDSQLNPEPFMGFAGAFYEREKSGVVDVVFEKLPEAIQNLLITIKTKFPAWKLFTAADPEFFTLRLENGLTIDEVFHQKKNFWDDFQQKIKLQNDDVVSYLKELIQLKRQVEQQEKEEREAKLLQNHEELKKVFDEKMKQLGLAQRYTKNMIFKTMDDVDHAIWIEKDPFFYTHMNMTFKKVSYPMTIIWGQYGQSHREQIAVEKFKNIDHEVFLGIRSN